MKSLKKILSLLLVWALLMPAAVSAAGEELTFRVTGLQRYDESGHQIVAAPITKASAGQVVVVTFSVTSSRTGTFRLGGYEAVLGYDADRMEPYGGDDGDTGRDGPYASEGWSALTDLGLDVEEAARGQVRLTSTGSGTVALTADTPVALGTVAFQVLSGAESGTVRLAFTSGGVGFDQDADGEEVPAAAGEAVSLEIQGETAALEELTLARKEVQVNGKDAIDPIVASAVSDRGSSIGAPDLNWSVTPFGAGVTISAGLVTVDPRARAGEYTITATDSGGRSAEDVLTVSRTTPRLTSLVLSPADVIVGSAVTISYEAQDQFGDPVEDVEIEISPSDAGVGLSMGQIAVAADARIARYEITAIKGDATSDTAYLTVRSAPAPAAGAANVEIVVPEEVEFIIPADGQADYVSGRFTAIVTDTAGRLLDDTVRWAISAMRGVSIDADTGIVTVTNEAKEAVPGTEARDLIVSVTTSNGHTATALVSVARAPSELVRLELTPEVVDAGEVQLVRAVSLDQYGTQVTDVALSMEPGDEEKGVAVSNTYIMVAANAKRGVYRITSTMTDGTGGSVYADLSVVRTVVIGLVTVTPPAQRDLVIPADGEPDVRSGPFTAVVLDTFWEPVEEEQVVWTIEPMAGVSIDAATGVVTVTNAAKASVDDTAGQVLTVTATTSNGKTDSSSVTVRRSAPVASRIRVLAYGEEVSGPETFGIPSSKTYSTQVVDQYGTPVSGVAADLSLLQPVAGVTVSGYTVSVTEAAVDGTEAILRATYGGVQETMIPLIARRMDVTWPTASPITYGERKQAAFTGVPGPGAAVYDGRTVEGRFSVLDPDEILLAGERTVGVRFTADVDGMAVSIDRDVAVRVERAPLRIPPQAIVDRIYDGQTEFRLTGIPDGLVNGDRFSFTLVGRMEKRVGTQTVTVESIEMESPQAVNYQTPTVTAPIRMRVSRRPVTIADVTAVDRPYDRTTDVELRGGVLRDAVNGGVLADSIPDDDVGLVLGTGVMADASVGNGKAVRVDARLTGADAENYDLLEPDDVTVRILPMEDVTMVLSDDPVVDRNAVTDTVLRSVDWSRTGIGEMEADLEELVTGQIWDRVQELDLQEPLKAEVSVSVRPLRYVPTGNRSMTLDVGVRYVLTTEDGTVVPGGSAAITELDRPVTVTVNVPRDFEPKLARLSHGTSTELVVPETVRPVIGGWVVSWPQRSFSTVELLEAAHPVTFQFDDGTSLVRDYDPSSMGTSVRVKDDTRSGYESYTWQVVDGPADIVGLKYDKIDELVSDAGNESVVVESTDFVRTDGEIEDTRTGTIAFQTESGASLGSRTYTAADIGARFLVLTKEGYRFEGWMLSGVSGGPYLELSRIVFDAVAGRTVPGSPVFTEEGGTDPDPGPIPSSDGSDTRVATIVFSATTGAEEETRTYGAGDVTAGTALPTRTRSNYTFNGWTVSGVSGGPFLKMTSALFEAAAGTRVTATASFTRDSSSSSSGGGGGSSGGGGGGGGGGGSSSRYSITVSQTSNGTVTASTTSALRGTTVTLTVTPASGYGLTDLTVRDTSGNTIATTQQGGGYTFPMPASAVTVSASFGQSGTGTGSTGTGTGTGTGAGTGTGTGGGTGTGSSNVTNPFTDVYASGNMAPFYDAIMWAYQERVTGGTSATTFSPYQACSRAQAMTFLWRAMGSPEPTTTVSPFVDVQPGGYFYKAVLWAVDQRITNGTTPFTFSPDDTVTRSQVVTFLYRASGESSVAGANPFTDVDRSSYYGSAVLWAVGRGITNGMTATTFAPFENCTRAQIVTFIYRYMHT